jgi:outer membrane protein TolC
MKTVKDLCDAKLDAGRISVADVAHAEYFRRAAETLLERERAEKPPGKPGEKLKKLLKAAVKAEQDMLKSRFEEYKAGKISVEPLLEAQRRLVAAELDFRDTKEDRLDLCETNVKQSKELKDFCQAKFEAGKLSTEHLAEAEYLLLDAEIALQRERAEKPPAKPGEKLKALLKARIKSAKEMREGRLAKYEVGKTTLALVIEAHRLLLVAELDARDAKKDRVAVCEENLKSMETVKEISVLKREADKIGDADVAEVEYHFLDAQIQLEREKAK